MLDGGIIQRLLEEKWKTFARVLVFLKFILEPIFFLILQREFLKRLLILFVHLLSLSTSIYLRPSTQNDEQIE